MGVGGGGYHACAVANELLVDRSWRRPFLPSLSSTWSSSGEAINDSVRPCNNFPFISFPFSCGCPLRDTVMKTSVFCTDMAEEADARALFMPWARLDLGLG